MDPDSFKGKLYLLVIDKLVVGALIAVAFIIYDQWKTNDQRIYELKASNVQLQFERAKLIKEFLPLITDDKKSTIMRAYLLRSAIITDALDEEAGIELGKELLKKDLDEEHFLRVMEPTMPKALPVLTYEMSRLSDKLFVTTNQRLSSGLLTDQKWGDEIIHSDLYEGVTKELVEELKNARIWRLVVEKALPRIENLEGPIESTEDLSNNFYGLFLLFNPSRWTQAMDMSNSKSRGISLVGNVQRIIFDSKDENAAKFVGNELKKNISTLAGIKLNKTILRILREFGPPSGSISISVSELLTSQKPGKGLSSFAREQFSSLQWEAGEFLIAMQENAKKTLQNGAVDCEPVLIGYITKFRKSAEAATSDEQLMKLESKKVSVVVDILGRMKSKKAKKEYELLLALGSKKLKFFPFLEIDLERKIQSY